MASTVWRGRLAFGLVSIPVRLLAAARRERIRFRHVARAPAATRAQPAGEDAADEFEAEFEAPVAPVRHIAVAGDRSAARPELAEPAGEVPAREFPAGELLKGYEVEKDRFVVFQRSELAALKPRTSSELEIVQFVKTEEVDPLYFDASYWAVPDRHGEKPYTLLWEALRRTGYAALGTFAMHGREHTALIRTRERGLVLHTLFYRNEIRSADAYHALDEHVVAQEAALAERFVEALAAPFEPERFQDQYEARIKQLIAERTPARAAEPARAAPVIDIMAALRRSLEQARKPPAREERPARPRRAGKRQN